jgi:hypothetical protein
MRNKGFIQLITSTVFFLASWWCLLWMFASVDMAFLACDGKYSLFHEQFRCRQPSIALYLWLSFGIACVALLFFGVKNLMKAARHNANKNA